MILIIDTSDDVSFTLALANVNGVLVYAKKINGQFIQAEKLLPELEKVLQKNKVKLENLSGVAVVKGPGGFTAIRIGVNTANTLAYALNIPVVGLLTKEFNNLNMLSKISSAKLKKAKQNTMIRPFYGREPNITKSKKILY